MTTTTMTTTMTEARAEHGFTLTELLAAMVVLGALLAVAYPLFASTIRHSGDVQERTVLQAEARGAAEALVRELRQAHTDEETRPLEAIAASQISFLSPDNAEPPRLRRIAYQMSGDRLERAVAVSTNTDGPPWMFPPLGGWAPRLGSIADPAVFTYQDATGAATSDPAAVRTITVTLVVAPRTSSERPLTYRTSVELRTAR